MYDTELTTADRIAMLGGGGLLVLAVVVLGFVNTVLGAPHLPVVEDGTVVATPVVPADLRAYMIALALAIWAGYAVYRLAAATGEPAEEQRAVPAD